MTEPGIDLDAYFARIGYHGPREASLRALRDLHRLHPAAIPFENMSPLIGEPVSLALPDLEDKLVRGGRGGYCYEHNTLFWAALAALGFEVTGLAARVRWGAPDDVMRPRTHMTLLVSLAEGQFLADVGFGGLVLTAPLALALDGAQQTPHERFRLAGAADGLIDLLAELDEGDWRPLYRFDLVPHAGADYEPLNWFSATHPASPFPSNLMAARAQPHRRLALLNTRFTVREHDRAPVERTLGSLDELGGVLRDDFGLTLPAGFARVGAKLGLR